jgi:hypothetical protein
MVRYIVIYKYFLQQKNHLKGSDKYIIGDFSHKKMHSIIYIGYLSDHSSPQIRPSLPRKAPQKTLRLPLQLLLLLTSSVPQKHCPHERQRCFFGRLSYVVRLQPSLWLQDRQCRQSCNLTPNCSFLFIRQICLICSRPKKRINKEPKKPALYLFSFSSLLKCPG